jgi:hypothetical protein
MKQNFILTEEEKRNILGLYGNPSSKIITEQQVKQGASGDPYQYKKEGNIYYYAYKREGANPQWKQQKNPKGIEAICTRIFGEPAGCSTSQGGGVGTSGANASGALAGGGAGSAIPSDGVKQSAVSPDCINVVVTGSFDANVNSNPANITTFINNFMSQINSNPLLKSSYAAGTLYVGGIKLTGGASNVSGGEVPPEVDNNYNPTTPTPGKVYPGNAAKNKTLAGQRANSLYSELQKQLPAMKINFGPNVTPIVTSMVVDTGGVNDAKRNTSKYPNPGQIVKCEIDLCGVNAASSTTGDTVTTGSTPTTDTGSTPTNLTTTQIEILDCFKDATIQVNYTGKGHKCNYAIYEIYVNGVKLKRTTGQDYASLNNNGNFDDARKEGEHRFNEFVIDKITATSFVNKESLYKYQGNLQIDAKCVLKNPSLAKGWTDPATKEKTGGCHFGVGNITAEVNGTEFSANAETPNKYEEVKNLANFAACKAQYEKMLQAEKTGGGAQQAQPKKQNLLGKIFNRQ